MAKLDGMLNFGSDRMLIFHFHLSLGAPAGGNKHQHSYIEQQSRTDCLLNDKLDFPIVLGYCYMYTCGFTNRCLEVISSIEPEGF